MPTVKAKGKPPRKFDYDPAGEAKAKAYAQRTGGKMTMKKGAKKAKKSKPPWMTGGM